MVLVGQVSKGVYFDSVTLMQCGKSLAAMPGVLDAAVVMGTTSNRDILSASGLLLPAFESAGDADLLIGVKAETQAAADAAMAAVSTLLAEAGKGSGEGESRPASLESALQVLPGANLALISVAGRYAGQLALSALEQGLHVMLFSDNVPLEQEIELKRLAVQKGLLMMGPDCGTAIINGVPLGFANAVHRGDIGIVAAAGTGLQEVSTIISNYGGGISQAIGTGGRDVKKAVGGVMFLQALKALAEDEGTKVILLVSKPPDPEVLESINAALQSVKKPVISIFVGAPGPDVPRNLGQAALMALAMSRGQQRDEVLDVIAYVEQQIRRRASDAAQKLQSSQKYVRGLFSGGTFCAEAQAIFADNHPLSELHSNVPIAGIAKLRSSLRSEKHTFIDFGEDEFTVGRPHPMIDFSLRNRRILKEAGDPETAIILLDVILGYGSHPDPASELSEIIRKASERVIVVCSVTGTDEDPQNRCEVKARLKAAGATVMPSNSTASKLAAYTIKNLEGVRAQTV